LDFQTEIESLTNLVKIPVSVNGQGPLTFILDTGASTTTLSMKLAERLGIPTRLGDRPEARGVGGGIPIEYADVTISLGQLEFNQNEVYVLDLENILRCGGNYDGVLGHSTLKHCIISLSYKNQRLKLNKDNSSLKLDWSKFRYIHDTHLVGVPVHINGKGPYDFVLDTGAGNSVVTPRLAEELSIEAQTVPGIARGIGGDAQLKLAAVSTLSVGSATVSDTQLVVIDLSSVSPKGMLIDYGIIGYDFLRNFETVIDYPNQRYSFIYEHNT